MAHLYIMVLNSVNRTTLLRHWAKKLTTNFNDYDSTDGTQFMVEIWSKNTYSKFSKDHMVR
jgi:hypothetical protein